MKPAVPFPHLLIVRDGKRLGSKAVCLTRHLLGASQEACSLRLGLGSNSSQRESHIPTAAAHAGCPAWDVHNHSGFAYPVVLDKVLEVDCRRLPHLHRHGLERDQLGGEWQGGRAAADWLHCGTHSDARALPQRPAPPIGLHRGRCRPGQATRRVATAAAAARRRRTFSTCRP